MMAAGKNQKLILLDQITSCNICLQIVLCWIQDCLSPLSMQALPDVPESLCIVEMGGPDITRGEDADGGSHSGLFLNIGLQVCVVKICKLK